jgi:hypothetical protein
MLTCRVCGKVKGFVERHSAAMVETNPAGFGANAPVPLGLRPAGAHYVMRLARRAHIALHRRPRGSPLFTDSLWGRQTELIHSDLILL